MKSICVALGVFLVALILLTSCGTEKPVYSQVTVTISPPTITLGQGATQQFTAVVTGTSQKEVIWSVTGCTGTACGTISTTGCYTAPSVIPANATVAVVATLQSDPTKSATATVKHVPPATNPTEGEAQGFYSGTSFIMGSSFYTVVMPNDMYYAFYGWPEDDPELYTHNLLTGQGHSASGKFTGDMTNFFFDVGVPVSLAAQYVPGVSMTGSIVVKLNGYETKFEATALPASQFEWDTPANLAHIAGNWQGGEADITVEPDGRFTGNSGGCTLSGTITPDSSNKNFFDLTITYAGDPCTYNVANQTGSGIAIETLLSDGISRHLFAGARVGDWRFVISATR